MATMSSFSTLIWASNSFCLGSKLYTLLYWMEMWLVSNTSRFCSLPVMWVFCHILLLHVRSTILFDRLRAVSVPPVLPTFSVTDVLIQKPSKLCLAYFTEWRLISRKRSGYWLKCFCALVCAKSSFELSSLKLSIDAEHFPVKTSTSIDSWENLGQNDMTGLFLALAYDTPILVQQVICSHSLHIICSCVNYIQCDQFCLVSDDIICCINFIQSSSWNTVMILGLGTSRRRTVDPSSFTITHLLWSKNMYAHRKWE